MSALHQDHHWNVDCLSRVLHEPCIGTTRRIVQRAETLTWTAFAESVSRAYVRRVAAAQLSAWSLTPVD